VRLSLVNLYLHGFTNPRVEEYDTLTSDEKWNEVADVILANPPFMSPKGGIKPHKRFSVQASRSEVLFVDYMAEHLTATGRAAIVVPEGIIFQSGTAYKALRKMLVDTSLVAVVSLPAGVFNPYSGVKTSILILDKRLHKQLGSVLFVKVGNDGFNLGAQRRAVVNSDLPEATRLLRKWMTAPQEFEGNGAMAQAVERGRIGENGDFNLSGERYIASNQRQSASYPLAAFQDVCTLEYGISLPKQDRIDGPYPVLGSNGITGCHNTFHVAGPTIVVGRKGSAGEVTFVVENCTPIDTTYYVKVANPEACDIRYLYQVLNTLNLQSFKGGAGIPGLNRNDVYEACKIPLPPVEVQHQIVAEIEGYQKIIDGARQVLDNYKPHIVISPDWPMVQIGEIFQTKSGTTPLRNNSAFFEGGQIPWVKTLDLRNGPLRSTDECVTELALTSTHLEKLPVGTVLVAMYGGLKQIGRTGVLEVEATSNQAMTALLPTPQVEPYFMNVILISQRDYWKSVANSTRKDPNITKSDVLNFKFPLPDLATQRAIVAEIEAEQALVNANRELIRRMEAKVKAAIDRVWGESVENSG
ncbi:MAG: N-6 DNA methylase, partial [Betaproteobacteria bacterium]